MTGPRPSAASGVRGALVDLDGDRCYRIDAADQMPPFLMTVTGASDMWCFLSSSGGITAGRRNASSALFPYYTEDKLTDHVAATGGATVLRLADTATGALRVWDVFGCGVPDPAVSARLYKSVLGDVVTVEREHEELKIVVRCTWRTSQRFGLLRTTTISTYADQDLRVEVLDGLRNLLPPGVTPQVQNRLSVLLDAYKRCELDASTGLGLASLSSQLTDLAEPSEALAATVVWHSGLPGADYLLSVVQLSAYLRGEAVHAEADVRGRRAAYLLHDEVTLRPGEPQTWTVVADVDHDAARVADLRAWLSSADRAEELRADATASRAALAAVVAAGDGIQETGDEIACVHHSANVLFNAMRGGIPGSAYEITREDARGFLAQRNREVAARHERALDGLPDRLTVTDLVGWADGTGDLDLRRLARELLPLTFSRRHGDPSRPWNEFDIQIGSGGRPRIGYQGNWRDIFQNWEALAWSYPELVDSMVLTFLNATTVDGYNPYRISHEGIDWEVPEPDDPWSNIGYWSDHQIVYLQRLLDLSERFHPGRLGALLDVPLCTFGDVPYRIDGYDDIVADPYDTITFDASADARARRRVATLGGDGRLVHDRSGGLLRATPAEKLLLLLAAKVVNLVPGGGIWMTTQRPEWNDANNALVGRGLSVVTVAQLRRYVTQLADLLDRDVEVGSELGDLLLGLTADLTAYAGGLGSSAGWDDGTRRAALDAFGRRGTAYRAAAYRGLGGGRRTLTAEQVRTLLALVRRYADDVITGNRRSDGLYHSYNTLTLTPGRARVGHLAPMLEGQVAVLGCGLLDGARSAELLAALRGSELYRADQGSYQLYPDKDLPGFLDRNTVAPAAAAAAPLLDRLADAGDRSLVVRDSAGAHHFSPAVRNARDVRRTLEELATDPRFSAHVAQDRGSVLDLFERTFRHAEFTGRSGTFFAYEGLGSVYWHMVAKLLLATQERSRAARLAGEPSAVVEALEAAYREIQAGLGYRRTPAEYGAFPTDPYSHTPAGQGARQPGMTGQVKEEVITRWGELGVEVSSGRVAFDPSVVSEGEWRSDGTLRFTFCGVPVEYARGEVGAAGASRGPGAVVTAEVLLASGERVSVAGGRLDAALSELVFTRSGAVLQIRVASV